MEGNSRSVGELLRDSGKATSHDRIRLRERSPARPRQKVREGLVDHLKEIRVTWAKALFLRDRLNELRITRVEVEGGLGGVVRAPSFFKSVLADENWTQF